MTSSYFGSEQQRLNAVKGIPLAKATRIRKMEEDRRFYNLKPKRCARVGCDTVIPYEVKTVNRFCSHVCSAKHNNSLRPKTLPALWKANIKAGLERRGPIVRHKETSCVLHLWNCKTCGEPFASRRIKIYCDICRPTSNLPGGKGRASCRLIEWRCVVCDKKKLTGVDFVRRTCSPECLSRRCSDRMYEMISRLGDKVGRTKKYWHNSPIAGRICVDGMWELNFCKWADSKGVHYSRTRDSFPYVRSNGRRARYYPDFKLDAETYLEVKGYELEDDRRKWDAFPHTLIVLKRHQIKHLKTLTFAMLSQFAWKKRISVTPEAVVAQQQSPKLPITVRL